MQAVILVAGVGSRLGRLVNDKPKCLLDVGGITILDYQINQLINTINIKPSKIFVVGGYKFETLKYLEDKKINLIYNPKYQEYNNIYSFYLINEYVKEDFILLNGDTLFHPDILKNLGNIGKGTYFVVDNSKRLGEEEMKVLIKEGRILRFGKDIPLEYANGEYIGIAKFDIKDAWIIFNKIKELIKQGITDIWYEIGINYVLNKIIAKPIYTNGLPWIEVDTPEDYKVAKQMYEIYFKKYF